MTRERLDENFGLVRAGDSFRRHAVSCLSLFLQSSRHRKLSALSVSRVDGFPLSRLRHASGDSLAAEFRVRRGMELQSSSDRDVADIAAFVFRAAHIQKSACRGHDRFHFRFLLDIKELFLRLWLQH